MILSVDTGLDNFGLAVIHPEDNHAIKFTYVIQSKKTKDKKVRVSTDYAARITHISEVIRDVIAEYGIRGITGEMPSFGFKSSKAAVSLTCGASIILTVATITGLPTMWQPPNVIKKTFTGDIQASKKKIMAECCKRYGWEITYNRVKDKKKPEGFRMDPVYHVRGKKLSAGYFEHVADAIAAYHTCDVLRKGV